MILDASLLFILFIVHYFLLIRSIKLCYTQKYLKLFQGIG